jgi:ankyrin repeat protein
MNFDLKKFGVMLVMSMLVRCQLGGMVEQQEITNSPQQWQSDLIQAVQENNLDRVNELLADQKGDVNAVDKNGWLVLYNAIRSMASAEIILALLDAGARVDLPTEDWVREYPLHVAARRGDVAIIRKICIFGPKTTSKFRKWLNTKDALGNTPLDVAIAFKHKDCKNLLSKFGARQGERR